MWKDDLGDKTSLVFYVSIISCYAIQSGEKESSAFIDKFLFKRIK